MDGIVLVTNATKPEMENAGHKDNTGENERTRQSPKYGNLGVTSPPTL